NSLAGMLGETLTSDGAWSALVGGVPYVLVSGSLVVGNSPTTLVTLTFAPGATFRSSGPGLFVGTTANRGALVAVGTGAQPITFTTNSPTPAPGQWQGLYFDDLSDDATSILDHCVVEYG